MRTQKTDAVESFVVKEILGPSQQMHGLGNSLSMVGLILETPAEVLANNRYLWLEFGLSDAEQKVKALGEIVERNSLSVKVRFKHLYPEHRRLLSAHLGASPSLN